MSDKKAEYRQRLREITEVLRRHGITRGVTPEKLRLILEELGPTFIKLGQIVSMHSDVLPKSIVMSWRGFAQTLLRCLLMR